MIKFYIVFIFCLAAFVTPLHSSEVNRGFMAGLTGGYSAPHGHFAGTFDPGAGFGATMLFYPGWHGLFVESNADFASFSMRESPNSTMSRYNLTAGPGVSLVLSRWLEPFMSLQGGMSHMRFNFEESGVSSSATKPMAIGTAGIMMSPFDFISLRFGAGYSVSELSGQRLYSTQFSGSAMMRLSVFTGRNIMERGESLARISNVRLKPIFGARYMSYADEGIGVATVSNAGQETLRDVRVDTAINEIESGPTKSAVLKSLAPGQSAEVELPLMIAKEILEITDTRELPVKMRVYYTSAKGTYSCIETKNATVHSRNSITWSDTSRVGSFITPREESASAFARNALSLFKHKMLPGFNKKLQEALILFDTLGAAGVAYATDPNAGFGKLDAESVDYVMFPCETLRKKAGDCDDLTVLYASLLESIGIKTAVVATPGHIFMMFDTEVPENSYTDVTADRALVHAMNGTVWVPVEVTMSGKPFLAAWKEGARGVNRHKGTRGFEALETAHAWTKFPPADIGSGRSISVPDREKINTLYALDMDQLKTAGFDEQAKKLRDDLAADKNDYRALNSLGILNAKFGKMEDALSYFSKAAAVQPLRSPAFTNLGNIYMLQRNYREASTMYEKAVSLNPDNHRARVSLARAYFETGKLFRAKSEYRAAIKNNPGYARRYAYLDSDPKVRAADPEERSGYNMWEK